MSDQLHDWQHVPRHVFTPLTSDNRSDYLAILACFEAAVFEPALNLETLTSRLGPAAPELAGDGAALTRALAALVGWQLLEESRDDSVSYSDPAEFQRRHIQWSLTHHGQATNAAVDAAFEQLRSSAALQPAVIDTIALALSEVADWLTGTGPAADAEISAQVHLRLFDAEKHHRSLVDNLRTFTREVTRALGRPDLDDDGLNEAKHHIISYLDRYVVSSELPARRVAAALDRLADIGFDVVASVATEGANLAPGLDGIDPRPAAQAVRRGNLDALHRWFRGDDAPPVFGELLPRGRDAVLSFLRVLGIRREIARRNATLTEDFRALARAFSRVGSNRDAHRLWSAATGLTPARHHHLPAEDGDGSASRGNRASMNPSAELIVELRRRPRPSGPPPHARPVPDARASRAAAQAREAVAQAELQGRRASLATDGVMRLSGFKELPMETFEVFVDLLGSALSASRGPDGSRSMRSTDGHVLVTIGSLDSHALTHRARIVTSTGTLEAPDMTVSIEILGRAVGAGSARAATGAAS